MERSRNSAASDSRNGAARVYINPRGSGLLLALLCLVLLAAPLPLGANRVWSWALLESALFCLLLGWVLASIGGRSRSGSMAFAGPCFAALGLWLLWATVYLVPLPAIAVQSVAPGVHSTYHQLHEMALAQNGAYYLSIDRHESLQGLLKYGMYAAAFFLVVALTTSRTRLKVVLYTVLASGVLQVLLALWARTMEVELTPRELMDGHWDVLRGTFVNRNHFAAFLAMAAATGIGLALAQVKPLQGGSIRARVAGILDALEGPVMICAAAVALVGVGMILSISRGGIAALGVAIILVLVLSLVARGRRARELILVWPLAVALLGALAWTGSRNLLDRLSTSGLVIDERWLQWAGTRDLILDHWLTGTGPGTYKYAYTAYKDSALRPLLYDHAHNDYLQVLVEHGVVGAGLLSVVLITILFTLIRSFMKRRDMFIRGVLFASLTGMLAMLIHSLVEFNFQIPANALYFWVLAGTGLAATRMGRGEPGEHGCDYGDVQGRVSRKEPA